MKFVADTSAVLSLACSLHLKTVLDSYKLIITNGVEKELQQFAEYSDELGLKATEFLQLRLLKEMPTVLLPLNLGLGETEVFSLAQEKKYVALTDDAHAARLVKEKIGLIAKPSFYLLLLLYKKKKITKEDLVKDMDSILVHRNWLNGPLWEYARKEIEKL